MKKLARFIFFLIPLLGLLSCGSNKVFVDNIKSFNLEYDKSRLLYHGDTITVNVYIVKKDGEKIDLSRSNQFEVKGEGSEYNQKNGLLTIDNRPTSFNQEKVKIIAVLTDENDAKKIKELTIPLSFTHPVTINFNGISGNDSRNRTNRVIGRAVMTDGKKGRDGDNGVDGEKAAPIDAYIWKENDCYKLKITYVDSSENYYFKTKNKNISISASGGDGGDGGDGGYGGRGKRGSKSKDREPGNVGNGGDGGNGANGGDGAMITLNIHPNAKDVKDNLKLIDNAGKAGKAGLAGEAGKGGRGGSDQADGEPGQNGEKGESGNQGNPGPPPEINVIEFDISKM